MATVDFTDQRERMRRSLVNALDGCLYVTCHEDGPSILVLEARRPDGGQHVGVRFLGLQRWAGTFEPPPGSPIKLAGVGNSLTGLAFWIAMFNPLARPQMVTSSRVRIDIGGARLDIECQDVEWWQDEALPGESNGQT